MGYIPVKTHLSRSQGKKLITGGAIALKKNSIGNGSQEIYLTRQQLDKLQKSMRGGKIKFSKAQLRYNLKHGKGVWDWIKKGAETVWDGAKKGATWVYDQVKPIVKQKLKQGVRAASKAVGTVAGEAAKEFVSKVPVVGSRLAEPISTKIKDLADKGADYADEMIGEGMRGKIRGRGPYTLGTGFVNDGKGLYTMGRGVQLPPPIMGVNSYAPGY